jgi:hypothetical protein
LKKITIEVPAKSEVFSPEENKKLKPGKHSVPNTPYWQKRIRHGDVTLEEAKLQSTEK